MVYQVYVLDSQFIILHLVMTLHSHDIVLLYYENNLFMHLDKSSGLESLCRMLVNQSMTCIKTKSMQPLTLWVEKWKLYIILRELWNMHG